MPMRAGMSVTPRGGVRYWSGSKVTPMPTAKRKRTARATPRKAGGTIPPPPPAIVRITRKFYFSASHRYWVQAWSEARNRKTFGPYVSPYGHGHNYVLEVTLEGEPDPATGMIINLLDVKEIIRHVVERYDHKFLNVDHPAFRDVVPTTERIAMTLGDEIRPTIPAGVRLSRLRLWEQEDVFAEVEYA